MTWTELHSRLLCLAFQKVLGRPDAGSMAFVRCLTPDVIEALALDELFSPQGWQVRRVADTEDILQRTLRADQAVSVRESKKDASLLLVDTSRAGAGMDGIYSAAREITEADLFKDALRLAAKEITNLLGKTVREYSEKAVKKARGGGRHYSVSPWTEFHFYARVAHEKRHPGELVWMLGLWPVQVGNGREASINELDESRFFVDRLLGPVFSGQTPPQRIASLKLLEPSEQQSVDLERLLRSAATRPLLTSLEQLASQPHLWINTLKREGATHVIHALELVPWTTSQGKLAKWSGMTQEHDEPPLLTLDPNSATNGNYSHLEVRWRARPDNLVKDSVQYHISIVTDMDEPLVSRDVSHSAKNEEKFRFTNDDFSDLSEDALINAKLIVSVIGDALVPPQESEEFVIRFGTPPDKVTSGVGKIVRTFSEGLIELDERETVTSFAASTGLPLLDSRGYIVLRTSQRGKNFRVYRPPLIAEVENDWVARSGQIGRWRVRVRASGARAGLAEFVPLEGADERSINASRRLAERFDASGGGVGQVYDQNSKVIESLVKDYLLAWAAAFDAEPSLALVNTVEIQSLSGRTVGLIVLPSHPLRVAWHASYDNLVLHTRFEQGAAVKQIREELGLLDGAMFPAFLPGLAGGTFVFADTLGFHAVGMVLDSDPEPKAAMAILARALGESELSDGAPTVGRQSSEVLGNEILKYIECHDTSRLIHIHALRPGDGLTVARSLGHVQKQILRSPADADEELEAAAPSFVLELYPSEAQRGIAGRFIAEARAKRRSGAGVVLEDDQWMLQSSSLPGGLTLPRLRWARKSNVEPTSAAHLAIAFDTFESRVIAEPVNEATSRRPYFAFGLMSFFDRDYHSLPAPVWRSTVTNATEGEKHPAEKVLTERLTKVQQAVQNCVVRGLNKDEGVVVLQTEISPDKTDELFNLHKLCDWVITLDRNAGIEYFDSPRDNRRIYEHYVIDCVPEREDLGCLQLITSTSNIDEVRNLLDDALDRMSLSRSQRNARFLLEHLKSLSGRLAIRLTGQKENAPISELIALALCHANCLDSADTGNDACWTALRNGFFMPVDDIRDLLPPVSDSSGEEDNASDEEVESARKATRPDLIHVSLLPRRGLLFRIVEVKYRRHLRTARSPETLQGVRQQVETLRTRWEGWYGGEDVCDSFRAVRRAKLARVLKFYADKARRHADDESAVGLSAENHADLTSEIDRLVQKGADYSFASLEHADRGWVFCPEYSGGRPLDITPTGWSTKIFLFGPDPSFRRGASGQPSMPAAAVAPTPNGSLLVGSKDEAAEGKSGDSVKAENAEPNGHEQSMVNEQASEVQSQGGGDSKLDPQSTETGPVHGATGLAEEKDSSIRSIVLGTSSHSGAEVCWSPSVRGNPHLLVAGLPGMGKTTCLLNLCRQMLTLGIRPIVFSYHQDIDEKLQQLVGTVRFVDFDGLGFNPLQVYDRNSRMAYLDVAGTMRDIFVAIFPELGDIQGAQIRKAIKDSFVELGWDDASANPAQLIVPAFSRFVEILRSVPKPDRGLRALLSRLDELSDYGFFRGAENGESLWDSELPVVLRIHSTQNDNLQKAFASLVFYGLYKDMFRRGIQENITHALIFDEAHRAAKLQLIPTMAKECRKYGISLVLASQEARDFHTSVFSAIANYLILRLTELDAKALARNVATSDQERNLIDRVKQLDRFQALYCSEGIKKPVPLRLMQ